ncbi:hypothetical protein K440DRAFT_615082, partial [Wilcoxina mikolae CBS 423.85]
MVARPLRRLGLLSRCFEHLYVPEAAQATQDTIRTGIHLHPGLDGQVVMSAKESPRSKGMVEGQKLKGNRKSKDEAKS